MQRTRGVMGNEDAQCNRQVKDATEARTIILRPNQGKLMQYSSKANQLQSVQMPQTLRIKAKSNLQTHQ